MTSRKYDETLFQSAGKVVVVNYDTCDFECYIREVADEAPHPYALHVMASTCPNCPWSRRGMGQER